MVSAHSVSECLEQTAPDINAGPTEQNAHLMHLLCHVLWRETWIKHLPTDSREDEAKIALRWDGIYN